MATILGMKKKKKMEKDSQLTFQGGKWKSKRRERFEGHNNRKRTEHNVSWETRLVHKFTSDHLPRQHHKILNKKKMKMNTAIIGI